MEHDFRYVSKNEAKEVKKDLLDIIHEVQDIVRNHFTSVIGLLEALIAI